MSMFVSVYWEINHCFLCLKHNESEIESKLNLYAIM